MPGSAQTPEAILRRLASDGANVVISDIGAAKDAFTPEGMIGASEEMAELIPGIKSPALPGSRRMPRVIGSSPC